ncbi:hypothetical protein CRP01_26515 [Flavilitoribacter nigricans DSM 23189 = NBRC 102662]|uniref:CHAT domain-containing protein n=1 Tax=Flavilitoribacter nigricans (strain ATCC 23147 / DSM 23189 / NBRC 102662 / NCIMB 1420 / SS-2) TaxID=1122177 RepID=A0A2D0N4X5_FLAN2|nr:hypothetical protein CRP01_26515 [Flavilitoribacter nigricans DSM 23189 = NBRC 102662]
MLLTFSNDQDNYLPMIVAEQKAIKQALLDHVDKNYLELRDVQHASTEEIFYLVNRYHQRLHIFHYGGHADRESLQLEREVGVVQTAHARGIAGLLGTQNQLKLVFLNGCATAGQVKVLLDEGVPAVIATRVPINDREAQHFGAQFYQALSAGSTIREAFRKARAFIETTRNDLDIQESPLGRGIDLSRLHATEPIPWGLYYRPDREEVLDWKLPVESPLEVNFGAEQWKNRWESPVNDLLVNESLKAIRESEIVKELARKIHKERKAGNSSRRPTDAEKKDTLVRAYPAPVSVHLRALFSSSHSAKYDEARLAQTVNTYQKTMQFLAFILLSDIWDHHHRKAGGIQLNEAERLQLRAFFELNAIAVKTFDYFQLLHALLGIISRNQLVCYVEELGRVGPSWSTDQRMIECNDFFQRMRSELEYDIPGRLIEAYGMEAEQRLAQLLEAIHFLAHYKMAVVKHIEVKQMKHMPPKAYRHIIVELDNNYQDIGERDRQQELAESTDMESVLLYRETLNKSLNLSPFFLDENALIREYNSKLYHFSHWTESGLCYYWMENEKDTLQVSGRMYPRILQQFELVRQDLLQEEAPSRVATEFDDDDILSVI